MSDLSPRPLHQHGLAIQRISSPASPFVPHPSSLTLSPLQPTTEATIQKAIMRMIATVCAVMLAYGLCSVSLDGRWLIPISTLVVAPAFWLLPDRYRGWCRRCIYYPHFWVEILTSCPPFAAASRSCLQLRTMGDLMYFCISFTFAYSMTMGYSGVYGIRETVLTRLASQVEGGGSGKPDCIALSVSPALLPM